MAIKKEKILSGRPQKSDGLYEASGIGERPWNEKLEEKAAGFIPHFHDISLWLLTLPAARFALTELADQEFRCARLTRSSD